MDFLPPSLELDPAEECRRITTWLRRTVYQEMRRHGGVVGVSGGVDSATTLALCVQAFGPENVTALLLPEKESDPDSERLARQVAACCGVTPLLENITPVLEGFGCYPRRDQAIQRLFPEYDPQKGYRAKIVLPQGLLEEERLNVFHLTILAPDGEEKTCRLPTREYLEIVAASNFKQRTRMAFLYYHAEISQAAVIGTANKNEHEQGFFVKWGDGGVDVQPIAHLYKTQVYQLASYLGVPGEILSRTPTTDTYSAPCTQEEFFFRLPFATMDRLWSALERGTPTSAVAAEMGLEEVQVRRAFNDFVRKERTTQYLRMPPRRLEA